MTVGATGSGNVLTVHGSGGTAGGRARTGSETIMCWKCESAQIHLQCLFCADGKLTRNIADVAISLELPGRATGQGDTPCLHATLTSRQPWYTSIVPSMICSHRTVHCMYVRFYRAIRGTLSASLDRWKRTMDGATVACHG